MGRPLYQVWDEADKKQRASIIKAVVDVNKQLFSLDFDAYGDLYETDFIESEANDASDIVAVKSGSSYSIGPHCRPASSANLKSHIEKLDGPCKFI